MKSRKGLVCDAFDTFATDMPALFMTYLWQTAGYNMAALTGVFSRLSIVDF